MVGDVVDIRPDRYLRELREHGDKLKALTASGMSQAEFDNICSNNVKFDRAQVECHLEFIEDSIQAQVRKLLRVTRAAAYAMLEVRHG
jgi:hypothetical protein